MLVLTRKSREVVVVGGGGSFPGLLKITVVKLTSGKVTLGFEVDGDVPVHRLEVWERMRASGEISSRGTEPEAPHVRTG